LVSHLHTAALAEFVASGPSGPDGPDTSSGETLTHMFIPSHADEWYLLTFRRRLNWVSMELSLRGRCVILDDRP
jgi:hypothetical protein